MHVLPLPFDVLAITKYKKIIGYKNQRQIYLIIKVACLLLYFQLDWSQLSGMTLSFSINSKPQIPGCSRYIFFVAQGKSISIIVAAIQLFSFGVNTKIVSFYLLTAPFHTCISYRGT